MHLPGNFSKLEKLPKTQKIHLNHTVEIDDLLQGSSTLQALKLNNSLAKEPLSTLDATKRATGILDAKYAKADLQSIVKNNSVMS